MTIQGISLSVSNNNRVKIVDELLRFYKDAAKVVQKRMVPNLKQSFKRAVQTARR